ncbi:hypothetical protein SAMN05216605_12196 [Pseudomonas abietaniphila]|uniref:Uncharacterized protein n=1 Tax=Pseudomonas abietaniphila TaxID=89065 RepID=A0A1G8QYK2_9PSED|nr:hypothetical protein SAMN05216605_12196 [Pseudomonas abietaniphila]
MKSTSFSSEIVSAAKEAPRIFIAPVLGAIKAVKAEFAKAGHPDNPAPSVARSQK